MGIWISCCSPWRGCKSVSKKTKVLSNYLEDFYNEQVSQNYYFGGSLSNAFTLYNSWPEWPPVWPCLYGVKYDCVQSDNKETWKKFFNNMCNVFTMELNLIVYTVTIRQLKNKTFDNIYNLFIMEFNIFVRNVLIRQLWNKASTTCVICSQWS